MAKLLRQDCATVIAGAAAIALLGWTYLVLPGLGSSKKTHFGPVPNLRSLIHAGCKHLGPISRAFNPDLDYCAQFPLQRVTQSSGRCMSFTGKRSVRGARRRRRSSGFGKASPVNAGDCHFFLFLPLVSSPTLSRTRNVSYSTSRWQRYGLQAARRFSSSTRPLQSRGPRY